MGRRRRSGGNHRPSRDALWVNGQCYSVQSELVVNERAYWVLDRLSTCFRAKYLAFEPTAGPRGRAVVLQVLPRSNGTWQQVKVLDRLSSGHASLPQITDFEEQ